MKKINVNLFWKNVGNILSSDGMTWAGLAEIAGLSPQSLSSAKHVGSDLRIGTLLRICAALGATPLELIEGVEKPEPVPRKQVSAELINLALSVEPDAGIMMLIPCLDEKTQQEILESALRLKGDEE